MQAPNILIVDDSSTIRTALTRHLEEMGAIVTQAGDGEEGYQVARSESFDLVITDIDMPGMSGFQLCEKLKMNPATHSIPIIILSVKEDEKHIEQGFRVGAAAYVTKTNAQKELRERIEEVLNRTNILHGRIVMVVDDSGSIRKLIGGALRQAGFQVILAENGKQALELARNIKPDLILSDLHMPVMDGFAFCRIMRSDRAMHDVPFIIMSSAGDRATMRRMLQQGASAFLVKPFNIDQLVITAEKLLADHFHMLLKEKERFEAERGLMLASIASLVLALEARDQYTRGHSDAVAGILVGMAQQMGFDAAEIDKVRITGKLHDLGKIGIRDDILLKPGPLSTEEYRIIKRHPTIAAEILAPIPSLAELIPAIASHHERMDGKGYPQGIKSGQIPLLARMIAVADTYDALTSDRPYRSSFPREKALQILRDVKGTQLCPECVEVFLAWIQAKE